MHDRPVILRHPVNHSRLSLLAVFILPLVSLSAEPVATENQPPAQAAPVQVSLTSPTDYEVFQRGTKSTGTVRIEGSWKLGSKHDPRPDKIEARLLAPDAAPSDGKWTALPFDPRVRGILAELPTPAGGWYRLELRVVRQGRTVAEADVSHVGVGEVFVIAGQSNSANYGEVRQRPASGLVSAFDGAHWAIANDPQPGATGTKGSFIPSFGDSLARRTGVPIGVVCIGVGSTSVREWMPRGFAFAEPPVTGDHTQINADGKFISSGELFDLLTSRLRQFPPGGIRAVLWHQGESDWNQAEGNKISIADYRDDLAGLIAASRETAGWNAPWFVAQVSYHKPTDAGSEKFRAAQRSVADGRLTFVGPNTDELTGALREKNGQGIHLSDAGLKRHGKLWADVVGAWLDRIFAGENARKSR